MTPGELLRRGYARLEDPSRWTKGWSARDAQGDIVSSRAATAVSWCALGALSAEDEERAYWPALRALNSAVDPALKCGAAAFNDRPGTRHGDVLALYRRAIAAVEEGQG